MADNKMIWSFFLQLSIHMWEDENSGPRGWYQEPFYRPTNDTDIAVWDELVKFIAERKFNMCVIDVGDGIRYESHPEISAPDAWSKDFLKKKLDEMRALGIEPIPKLNFSACHHTWLHEYRRMLCTPAYYKVCADLIAEVCEVFGTPRFFHLGMDEETYRHQQDKGLIAIRQGDVWWHDAFFLFKECEKNGVRPWVWSDYYWDHPDLFEKNMPKSVLQSNWYYDHFRDYPEGHPCLKYIDTYRHLDELGYEQIPGCSTWSTNYNEIGTLLYGRNRLNPAGLLGYMTIPWCPTTGQYEFYMKNDAHQFYDARRKVYPESLCG